MNENRTTNPDADLEPDTGDAPAREEKPAAYDSPVRIRFTHYRHRLCDPDGLSVKAVIDGLVAGKVLADDSAKCVEEVTHRQVKAGRKEQEKTVIEIEELRTNETA